jgi:hypothetical protein
MAMQLFNFNVRAGDSVVKLRNSIPSFDMLFNEVSSFYRGDESRIISIFEEKHPDKDMDSGYFVRFLLERKHVVEYRIANDRGFFLSILSLAIGPHYFPPADFWDYENSQRFSLEASTEAIVHNLKLLDEFLTRG